MRKFNVGVIQYVAGAATVNAKDDGINAEYAGLDT